MHPEVKRVRSWRISGSISLGLQRVLMSCTLLDMNVVRVVSLLNVRLIWSYNIFMQ